MPYAINRREDGVIVCRQTYQRGDTGYDSPLMLEHDAVTASYGPVDFVGAYPSDRQPNQYTHESHWRPKPQDPA